ncbi:MAG: hypothetical protein JJU13_08665 [Balneolaceae bacterium]|nr:hypothetical protein [Balneolaceae bacterium]
MLISSSISKILIWLAMINAFIISGCSHTSELYRVDSPDVKDPMDYSIIYYIHANSDYLYHDGTGKPILFKKGLKTWYKPARFGKRPNTSPHSGWACKPITDRSFPRVNS